MTYSLNIDGSRPLNVRTVADLSDLCDQAEDHSGPGIVTVRVTDAPAANWTLDLTVALVSKWERAVRRFERLPMTTVAVASGDCGGTALEVLLATDYRIAAPGTRLMVPVEDGVSWPSMALYRLVHQAGPNRVRQAALFGAAIGAEEALTSRLVDEVTEDAEGALAAAAESLAGFSGSELAIRRQLVSDAVTRGFEDVLGMHLAACDRTLRRLKVKETTA